MPRPRTLPDSAILEATARLIGRYGVPALTLAKVADEVGLAPATLVQRFGSKRGLLVALGADAADRPAEPFARASEDGHPPLDAIVAGLAGQVADIGSAAELAHHVGFLQLDLTDDELYAHARNHHRGTRRAIEELLADAAARGELSGAASDSPNSDSPNSGSPNSGSTAQRRLARDLHVAYQGVLITWALDEAADVDGRRLESAVRDELRRVLEPHRSAGRKTDPDGPTNREEP